MSINDKENENDCKLILSGDGDESENDNKEDEKLNFSANEDSSSSCELEQLDEVPNNNKEIFESNSTKNTDQKKSLYKAIKRKPSRSIDEDLTTNHLTKKEQSLFAESPKKALFRRTNTYDNRAERKKMNRKSLSFLILGPMKTKGYYRKPTEYIMRRKKEEENNNNKKEVNEIRPQRFDNYGTLICKKNRRKVKIYIPENFKNVIEIESFKNLNYIRGMPREYIPQQHTKCQCCVIY